MPKHEVTSKHTHYINRQIDRQTDRQTDRQGPSHAQCKKIKNNDLELFYAISVA